MSDQAAKNLAALVQQTGASALVRNLETEVFTQCVGAWTVPASLNTGISRTCYINSPSRAFLDYGAEALDRLTENRLARLAGRGALAGLLRRRRLRRARADHGRFRRPSAGRQSQA